jgi:hypothetical protein
MQLKTYSKIVAAGMIVGAVALGGVACSSTPSSLPPTVTQTATQTITQPVTVTVTPLAASSPVAKNLILSSDMVAGSGGTVPPTSSCVLASQFKLGNQVVFRIRVYDPVTGQPMDDKALSSVTVTLPDGQSFKAKYSGHPSKAPLDSFWATSWVIPANYPTGTLSYKTTATSIDGRTGAFDNFNVQPSLLTVVQ